MITTTRITWGDTFPRDGREVTFRDGDKVPLVDGRVIEANKEVDFQSLDIDVDKL